MTNTIRVTKKEQGKSISPNHRKENKFYKGYLLAHYAKGEIHNAMDVRIYYTDSRCYCCIWIHASTLEGAKESFHTGGSAYAGGYGYCKESQAIESAMLNAGLYFNEPFGGHGTQAAEQAMLAIGKDLGLKKCKILRSHG